MKNLAEKSKLLRDGTYFVTFTKQLRCEWMELISSQQYCMSWGNATVHVHRKRNRIVNVSD